MENWFPPPPPPRKTSRLILHGKVFLQRKTIDGGIFRKLFESRGAWTIPEEPINLVYWKNTVFNGV
jgi:hypothetical protein